MIFPILFYLLKFGFVANIRTSHQYHGTSIHPAYSPSLWETERFGDEPLTDGICTFCINLDDIVTERPSYNYTLCFVNFNYI